MSKVPKPVSYSSYRSLPNLGTLQDRRDVGLPGLDPYRPMYHIFRYFDEVLVEEIPQRAGGVRYTIDEGVDPHCTHITPGGMHKSGTLFAGTGGSLGRTDVSRALDALLHSVGRKVFLRSDSFWFGPEAVAYLRAGGTLATTRFPPDAGTGVPIDVLPANVDEELARLARSRERILTAAPNRPAPTVGEAEERPFYRVVRGA